MRFSRRAERLAESATMRVSRRASELKAAGHDMVDLSAGQPDLPSPESALDGVRQALLDGHTRYTAAAGLPDLRAALAARYRELYGAPWTAAHTIVTVGAKAALFQIMQVLIDDGDEAVLPRPAWVSFEEQIRFAGGKPVTVNVAPDDQFAIRAAPLIAACTERTRLILLNSPCNPTGGMIAAAELRLLVEFCAQQGIRVLCDETYERFVYDGAQHASGAALAAEFPDTVVVISSFSKTYSMTGWRLGWAMADQRLINKVIQVQSHATSNPTSFAMYGALAVLEQGESDVLRMLAAFERRRQFVVQALSEIDGVRCSPPAGAFYAFPNISARFGPAAADSIAMAERLLEGGVAVVPGAAFGADDHIRLSFASSLKTLERGIDRLRVALRSI